MCVCAISSTFVCYENIMGIHRSSYVMLQWLVIKSSVVSLIVLVDGMI